MKEWNGETMKLKYISWIPAVFIMIMIFNFSSKTANTSDESSTIIADGILNVYENITDVQLQEDVRDVRLSILNYIVRKSAHFTEYLLLSLAFIFQFVVWKKSGWRLFLWVIGLTAIYAASDEFHQLFIMGRSGRIQDVMIDTTGAIFGFLLFSLMKNRLKGKAIAVKE